MFHRARVALILAAACSACSERTVTVTTWGDESTASSIAFVDGVLDGPYLLFHPGGKRHIELHYAAGLKHGLYAAWYPDGQRLARGAYEHGLRVGEWEEWDEAGIPKTKGSYRSGDKDGVWVLFDEKGRAEVQEVWVLGTRVSRAPL